MPIAGAELVSIMSQCRRSNPKELTEPWLIALPDEGRTCGYAGVMLPCQWIQRFVGRVFLMLGVQVPTVARKIHFVFISVQCVTFEKLCIEMCKMFRHWYDPRGLPSRKSEPATSSPGYIDASIYESRLMYIHYCASIYALHLGYNYTWTMPLIHLYMSHVPYTSICKSRIRYIYKWVMSPTHLYMRQVPNTSR